ncbi:hypothetical protein O3G_MSEX009851 [Manduca sexta]|uniref:Uncharacterized protein n=1 Tax=Manduca sexta TaxID=7130 RepID=A0A921ZGZ3_MANSE|nr:hypothetical protein O3G_MSEX009851 [Manduca sexta]
MIYVLAIRTTNQHHHCSDVRPNGACIKRRATRLAAFYSHYLGPWQYILSHTSLFPLGFSPVFLLRCAFFHGISSVLARCGSRCRNDGRESCLPTASSCAPPSSDVLTPTDCRRAVAGADHVHTINAAKAEPDHVHFLLIHVAFQLPGELPPEPATYSIYVPFA